MFNCSVVVWCIYLEQYWVFSPLDAVVDEVILRNWLLVKLHIGLVLLG